MIHSFSMENKGHDSQFFNENHRSGLRNIYSSNSESYNKSTVGPCTLLFSSKKKVTLSQEWMQLTTMENS